MTDFRGFLVAQFRPGAVYAFVGAGGKTTAMRKVAECCASRGLRVRITTTTRLAADELASFPRTVVSDAAQFREAMEGAEAVRVVVSAVDTDANKLMGVDPSFVDDAPREPDLLLLVEADGSRRRPLKIPTARDPVIPLTTTVVVGLMGASGFGEAISEEWCYNHAAALTLLGRPAGVFDARSIARIALHPAGLRKGVLPGMGFRVIVTQADIDGKLDIARAAVEAIGAGGAEATLLSWPEEGVYEPG